MNKDVIGLLKYIMSALCLLIIAVLTLTLTNQVWLSASDKKEILLGCVVGISYVTQKHLLKNVDIKK